MNYLIDIESMRNNYFVLRHGHSVANQQGIIVSDPDNGVENFGLSEQGELEVSNSVTKASYLTARLKIISSDFKRARESAGIAQTLLNTDTPVSHDQRLRERNFGEFELADNHHYDQVWLEDKTNPDHRNNNVESANQVMARVTSLIAELEETLANEIVLLVSHGDTLQILETAFHRKEASQHRSAKHLDTGQIRRLSLY